MPEPIVIDAPLIVTGVLRPLGGIAGQIASAFGTLILNRRVRVPVADINAAGGATLLAAITYGRFRLVDFALVAIGGNASGGNTRITAMKAGGNVQLAIVASSALDQNAAVTPSSVGVTLLADGAWADVNDRDTAIRLTSGGGTLSGVTHVDAILSFAVEFEAPPVP